MNKLALLSMAATVALIPASANALQGNIANPPTKWEDVPPARLNVSSQAGTSWTPRSGGAMAQRPAPPMRAAPPQMPRGAPPQAHPMGHRPPNAGVGHGGGWTHAGTYPTRPFPHYQRFGRGARMPHFWSGPRYRVNNWRLYGFPAPRNDWWWVRYYDDALLVDRDGMVQDGRWGVDWDRYGERWERDEYGVPAYVGDGDYAADGDDYAYVEDYEGDERDSEWAYDDRARGEGGHYGYSRGYGYGYGGYGWWGYGGPVVITETTVTTAPTVVQETVYIDKDVVVRRPHKRVKYRAKPKCTPTCCDCSAPPPPPLGEKG